MLNNISEEEDIYINEIIRVTYKCNWQCKFCNVIKTNNFWESDVSNKEVIYKILNLKRKYSNTQRSNLILSFSWGEPTLNKYLIDYIKLAKSIWVWTIQIQTNWTTIYNNKEFLLKLIKAWLDELFIAQHSLDKDINKNLKSFFIEDNFIKWINFIRENELNKKVQISFNIVVTKINLFWLLEYLLKLKDIWFLDLLPIEDNFWFKNTKRISFWLVQPNWYAYLNRDEVLLKYDNKQIKEIDEVVKFCKENNIYPDFHYTAPPVCILNYPEYNLEYHRLKKLEEDRFNWKINEWNLESYMYLWKEKRKFKECDKCNNNKYCLGFYNNLIDFIWEDKCLDKVKKYIYD